MAEYIEREAFLNHMKQTSRYFDVKFDIESFPAADVAPVVHRYWESYDCSQYMGTDEYSEPKWRNGKFYVCHNHRCRRKTVVKSHYCPNCGAKMDVGDK